MVRGTDIFHPALQTAQLALVTTAVFYRSAWRYEDQADSELVLTDVKYKAQMRSRFDAVVCVLSSFLSSSALSLTSILNTLAITSFLSFLLVLAYLS